ncbi:MAG: hypothetical protein ABF379_12980 [Akkermansiaceae bacterium]
MNYRIAYERAVNMTASGLAMMAQRLPFLKNLTPFFGTSGGIHFAAPVTVSFLGTHALSGQSIMIVPLNGATDTETIGVGEQFVWSFNVSRYSLQTASADTDGVSESLPEGLDFFGPQSGVMTVAGIPTEPGEYEIVLFAYRRISRQAGTTAPYTLTLTVEGSVSPFQSFMTDFFTEEEFADPAIVGPTADPDLDGIDNQMEFVLDLDPAVPDSMPGTIGKDPGDPQKLRYELPLNVLATEAIVEFEETVSLEGQWQPAPAEFVERTDDKIVLTAPLADQKFYRLKVVVEE